MAIVLQPEGGAERAAAVGAAIGSAEKQKRQQEMDFRQQMQQAAQQWELEKMLARSQQDFAQELRREQYRYDAENRTREWEIEKAEIASRMDYAAKEKARAEKITRALNTRDHIQQYVNKGELPEGELNKMLFTWAQQVYEQGLDIPEAYAILGQVQLTPEEQAKALRVEAGLEPRATATRPTTETPQDIAFEQFRRLDQVDKVLSSFEPNVEKPGWEWGDPAVWELAVVNEKGKPIREATPSEKDLHAQALQVKQQIIAQNTQQKYRVGQNITRGGKQYRIVGFDTDGTPLVEGVR